MPLIVLSLLLIVQSALAFTVDEPLEHPAQEGRAKALFVQIRCVVCQSESIADSPADVAKDMRTMIRNQISAGKTDQEILRFLSDRYGEAILMRPPLSGATSLLWFGPLLILLAALWLVKRYFDKAAKQP